MRVMMDAMKTPTSTEKTPTPARLPSRAPDVSQSDPRLAPIQQSAGNLATQRLLRTDKTQPSLAVSQRSDPQEHEADRAAEQVVAAGSADVTAHLPGPRRELPPAPLLIREALGSSGLPLDASTRAPMEALFGSDLSPVRIHTGARADASARALNALAYTVGNEIVFREGHHAPERGEGRRLLAHELAHVVRDSTSPVLHRQKDPAVKAEDDIL
jgi:hypothetical protein